MPFRGELGAPSLAEAEMDLNAEAVFGMLTGHWTVQIVRAAADLRLADHIGFGTATAEAIARREGSDVAATRRLMRACVTLGLLAEEGCGRYALTLRGHVLREDARASLRDVALLCGAEDRWACWGSFPATVRRPAAGTGTPLAGLATGPSPSVTDTVVRDTVVRDTIALLDVGEARVVADIGGGDGALILSLLAEHEQISGLLLDLQPAAARASKEAADRGLADRFEALGGDFFAAVPPADYHLLKWVLHEWPDTECRMILSRIREAAGPGGRLLVVEAIVGVGVGVGVGGTPDPAVLLDMDMLATSAGRVRDLAEFDALFDASGWRRTGVRRTSSVFSLIDLEAA